MKTLMFAVNIDRAGGAPPTFYRRHGAAWHAVFGTAAAGLPSSARRWGLVLIMFLTLSKHNFLSQHFLKLSP
jgi:hypothetical protein